MRDRRFNKLFKNKLITLRDKFGDPIQIHRRGAEYAESAQRGIEKKKDSFSTLFSARSLRNLRLCDALSLVSENDQFIFERTRRYSAARQQASGRAVKPLADARCYAIGMNKKLYIRLATQSLLFLFVLGTLLFLPAGTFDYWEAWAFIAVFIACNLPLTIWVAINDPQLLERRMRAGPTAEKEKSQKIIVTIAFLAFAGELLIPALDHRFGWSDVSPSIVILG